MVLTVERCSMNQDLNDESLIKVGGPNESGERGGGHGIGKKIKN